MVAANLLAGTAVLRLDGRWPAPSGHAALPLLHVAARMARGGRDDYLRIDKTWPWRDQLDAAFGRLCAALC